MKVVTDLIWYGLVPFASVYLVAALIHAIHVFFDREQAARLQPVRMLDEVECEAEFVGPISYDRRER